jgi:hypothetical protein
LLPKGSTKPHRLGQVRTLRKWGLQGPKSLGSAELLGLASRKTKLLLLAQIGMESAGVT